jgi:putative ABC transport system ATP-binding protein
MIVPERQVMIMNILEVQNLCKTYGKGEAGVRALDNVSFSVGKGEFIAIVGESGSGKSTLLNVLGALDSPTSGKVLIDGKDIFSMPEKSLRYSAVRISGLSFSPLTSYRN